MSSWLFAYTSSFLGTDKAIFDYLRTPKDTRLWIGVVESILGLAYIRFRSGAKFRLRNGFKIANDHSHQIKVGDYQFNFQGIKRKVLGGDSRDLLNFKTPLFYSFKILNQLRPENREVIIQLAQESVQSLLDTYKRDIMATEALKSMDRILNLFQENDQDKLESAKEMLYINEDYLNSPLTGKNIELWEQNIGVLDQIGNLFRQAKAEFLSGHNPENILTEIRDLQESIRIKLEEFLMTIPRGGDSSSGRITRTTKETEFANQNGADSDDD